MLNNSKAFINAEILKRQKRIRDVKIKYSNWIFCYDIPVLNWFVPCDVSSKISIMRRDEFELERIQWFVDYYKLNDNTIFDEVLKQDGYNEQARESRAEYLNSDAAKHFRSVGLSPICDTQDFGEGVAHLHVMAKFTDDALRDVLSKEDSQKLAIAALSNLGF